VKLEKARLGKAERLEHLRLELEAFDGLKYAALVAQFGDTGIEDFQSFLKEEK
jgi:hypothetical protein